MFQWKEQGALNSGLRRWGGGEGLGPISATLIHPLTTLFSLGGGGGARVASGILVPRPGIEPTPPGTGSTES